MLENRAQNRSSQYVESGIDWFEWSCEKWDFCAFEHAGFDSAAEHFIFSGICTDIDDRRIPCFLIEKPGFSGSNAMAFGATTILCFTGIDRLPLSASA